MPPHTAPRIVYHSLVGFPWQNAGLRKPTLPKALDLLQEAGFGATVVWNWKDLVEECGRRGILRIGFMDAGRKDWKQKLEETASLQVERINVQLLDHDTPPEEAVDLWLRMEDHARRLGVSIDLETHRDTCTETPEKILAINGLYRHSTGHDLRFCWDFSHFAVSKHLNPPFAPRLLARPFDRLVRRSRMMHARAFNGQHCQIPVLNRKGDLTPEMRDYLPFVDALLACWLSGARAGDVLHLMPEQLTTAGGYGLSVFENVWEEVKVLRTEIHRLWLKNLRGWKARHMSRP